MFLDELKVPDLHGFAWSATEKLETKFGPGATVLAEVRKKTKGALQALLGEKTGEKLWKAVRGLDDTRLESDKPRKSVSSEVNVGTLLSSLSRANAPRSTRSGLKAMKSSASSSMTLRQTSRAACAPSAAERARSRSSS